MDAEPLQQEEPSEAAERFESLMLAAARDVDMSRPVLALVRADERLGKAFDAALEGTGVTAVQFNVLMELAADDGRMALCDVAGRLLRSPANISALIDRMERDGLVRRVRGARDRRRVLAQISEKGWKALERAAPAVFEAERTVLAGLSQRERRDLASLLDRLVPPADQPSG